MKLLLKSLSPATAMSALALFVALGGAGYAATTIGSKQIANNSVASQDLRNNSASSADIRDATILPKDLSPRALSALQGGRGPAGPTGAAGPAGPPGAPATSMFAYVRVFGTEVVELAYGKGVIAAEQTPNTIVPGRVSVTFERDLRGCVVQATPGVGRPRGVADFNDVRIAVFIDPDAAEGVQDDVALVRTFAGPTNNTIDASFMISAFC